MLKKFVKNLSWILVARLLFRLFSALVIIMAARYLGAEKFGQLETATALVNSFIIFSGLGMSMLMLKVGGRNPEKLPSYYGNALVIHLVLSVFIYIALIITAPLLGYSQNVITLVGILGIALLAFEVRKPIRSVFRVRMHMKPASILEIINGTLTFSIILGITLFVADKYVGLVGIAITQLVTNLLILLLLFRSAQKELKPKFNLKMIPSMVKESYIYSLYFVFFSLYFQIDQIMISLLDSEKAVGFYSSAAKLILFLMVVPQMMWQLITPIMYRLSEKNMKRYREIHDAIHRYLTAFGTPVAVGAFLLADQIIPLIYGAKFEPSIPVLQVLSIYIFLTFFGNAPGHNLTTIDKQGLRTVIQVATIFVNIGLNFYFIPEYGFLGAAIATTITEFLYKMTYVAFSVYYLKEKWWAPFKPLLFQLPALGIMVIFVYTMRDLVPVVLLVILAGLLYVGGLILFRYFTPYDRKLVSDLLKKS